MIISKEMDEVQYIYKIYYVYNDIIYRFLYTNCVVFKIIVHNLKINNHRKQYYHYWKIIKS